MFQSSKGNHYIILPGDSQGDVRMEDGVAYVNMFWKLDIYMKEWMSF